VREVSIAGIIVKRGVQQLIVQANLMSSVLLNLQAIVD
jgi:Ca2+/H+ antiporter